MSETYYHTVTVEGLGDDGFSIMAKNNDDALLEFVGSVAVNGEAAGLVVPEGEQIRFEAADSLLTVSIVDFTDEYGYTEAQISKKNS